MTIARNAPAFLVLLALVVFGQWFGGAYQAEFIGDSDEPAHYVTGLMVRDYLAAGLPWPPLKFAQRFHEQYPRVALGHWPPFFYIIESVWMLIFGEGRYSILLLMASIQALWAFLCLKLFGRFFGRLESWLATLFLIATPEALVRGRMVMTEILMALLTLAALWSLHKLFEQPGWKWSVAFGAIASATMLTKGTGVFLAPMPILAVLALRRWDLLKSPWFWLPAVMVGATCGPWYALAPFALHEKAARFGGPALRPFRFGDLFIHFASQLSWPVLALSLAGLWRTAVRILQGEERSPFWILSAWTVPVAWAFHVYIGAWHNRHLIMVTPFMLFFAVIGFHWVFGQLTHRKPALNWVAALIVTAIVAHHLTVLEKKRHRGLDEMAKQILSRPELARSPLLIVSDAAGEGAFIAEIAMRETRPGHVVVRGYKALTIGTKIGLPVSPRFNGAEETMAYFHQNPDTVLVYDPAGNRDPNGQAIGNMLKRYPNRWRKLLEQRPFDPKMASQSPPIRAFVQTDIPAQ